ncbi:2-hydroxychromene-2-carboxylate isomerase/DsbA-like thioredoxin domain protein [Indibacter alkaliphilus LW1]|uniref:2-hydroxychromene-2-carboxylate isomerase/DsbA-like thioredoxin domain protein n=1 Tax=Indibacter alkaliphilus (strain CCUG 57479 / KCTC 22604 / LW1) TaxID=1189612 RepID=S2D335_INDAL|nr:DsbA family oxidoreductase [Indibacter alkaliphilus]EOZ93717.1 2-hydroxychromene-2-carboxylate isomerase/DsbA-like thioredoxin domain protein [Indibacter alkaliphilus LW1]
MKIEIWSDIMCPFCYIGKRRLESALKDFEFADKVEIEWKSFLLNPDMKTDPDKSTLEYLSETKGWSLEQTKEITQQVTDMAKEEGLHYKMEQTVVANARNAHRLLQLAKVLGKGSELKERLLKAYFTEGANIDDQDSLLAFAQEVGIQKERALACLSTSEFEEKVDEDIYESRQLGVRGVPFFVLDRKYGISGAQPKEAFVQTIEKAWEDFVKKNPVLQFSDQSDPGTACDIDGNCD